MEGQPYKDSGAFHSSKTFRASVARGPPGNLIQNRRQSVVSHMSHHEKGNMSAGRSLRDLETRKGCFGSYSKWPKVACHVSLGLRAGQQAGPATSAAQALWYTLDGEQAGQEGTHRLHEQPTRPAFHPHLHCLPREGFLMRDFGRRKKPELIWCSQLCCKADNSIALILHLHKGSMENANELLEMTHLNCS